MNACSSLFILTFLEEDKDLYKTKMNSRKIVLFLLVSFVVTSSATAGSFKWIAGNSSDDVIPVFGTKGVAEEGNGPGGVQAAVLFPSSSPGDLYLFGGYGFYVTSTFGERFLRYL